MKKNKIVIIILILGILFLTSYLYNTYATSTGVSLGNDENTYDILLNDSTDTVSVPAKSSKTIYYQFSNTNKGTVKYHIGYSSNNVIAKVWWDTEDSVYGTIEYGEYKFIKLKLINESTEDGTITIKPVLGYENGGDLVVPNNTTLVTGTINQTNTMSTKPTDALSTLGISNKVVKKIFFVNDNIVPSGVLGSTNMNNDGTVKLWYFNSDTSGLYDVYIGSDNGITSFPEDSSYYLASFTKLDEIHLDNINTSNVITMAHLFDGNLVGRLDLTNFETSEVKYMNSMFTESKNLETVFFGNNFDTSSVEDMHFMFNNCKKIKSLDLSGFDTSKVKDMSYMFNECNIIEILNLSSFDTSKVKYMQNMFYNCFNLNYIDIHSFDTSIVENMDNMFCNCYNIVSLNLNNFNTVSVKNMHSMFNNMSKLVSLQISNFDTSSVTNMSSMFHGDNKLTNIDLSSFVLTNISDISNMFDGCSNLLNIYLNNADISLASTYSDFLSYVPYTATIYLKDTQGNRDFMNNNFSTYTNVQYIPSS